MTSKAAAPPAPRSWYLSAKTKPRRNLCESRVVGQTARQARQSDHVDIVGEVLDARDRLVERHMAALAFAHDDGRDIELSLRQHMQRGQRMADSAEIASDHQEHAAPGRWSSSRARCAWRRAEP